MEASATGAEINGERVLELFKPGRAAFDSALDWFVDLRCRGRNLPEDPESIRGWFLEQGPTIQTHLERIAEELRAGMDSDWPLTRGVTIAKGVEAKFVCSAVRRLTGRDIGKILLNLGKAWPRLIASLPSCVAETAACHQT